MKRRISIAVALVIALLAPLAALSLAAGRAASPLNRFRDHVLSLAFPASRLPMDCKQTGTSFSGTIAALGSISPTSPLPTSQPLPRNLLSGER